MVDFSAPSFSLGLGLGLDSDLSTEEQDDDGRDLREDPREEPSPSPLPGASCSASRRWVGEEGEDEVEAGFASENLEEFPLAGTPALKRLKRGPPKSRRPETPRRPATADPSTPYGDAPFPALDDDIDECSSQEDGVSREYRSRENYSACSSSKFSLHGQRILTTMSARKLKTSNIKENSSIPMCVEASSNKKVFLRLTTSPLKRIQLLDSDSDDLSICRDRCKDAKDVDTSPKTNGFAPAQSLSGAQQRKTEIFSSKCSNESLWKDFSPKRNFNFATPALDAFCEEYFKTVKYPIVSEWTKQHAVVTNSGVPLPDDFVGEVECHHQKSCLAKSVEHDWSLPDPQPPSHQYFYHSDARIQKLVRQRLPDFIPLGDMTCIGSQQPNAGTFDYMSQFGQRKVPSQVRGANREGLELGSKVRPRNRKNAKGKEVAEISGNWVSPRSSSAIPKDAGKRRVHADGHSFGHWYTGQDGKKVYVTKNGQELSGRIAYKQYIKESGARFRKSRKKAPGASKKKTKR